MSAIPPTIIGATLQTSQAQQQAAAIQRSEAEAKDNAFRSQVRAVDQRDTTVSVSDDDTRINADGGGTGGRGRAFREPGPEAPPEQVSDEQNGITVDEAGRLHLDVEA